MRFNGILLIFAFNLNHSALKLIKKSMEIRVTRISVILILKYLQLFENIDSLKTFRLILFNTERI